MNNARQWGGNRAGKWVGNRGGNWDDIWAKIVLSPTVVIALVFIYGFIVWTGWISLTKSTLLPVNKFAGIAQYKILFANERWWLAIGNLFLFSGLFLSISIVLGFLLAVFLDQKIRMEGFIRAVYLYPMALSFIVTGTIWRWILNPTLGLEKTIQGWGWTSFELDWLINPDKVVYALVLVAVWQSSGFVMALFLSGLRAVDGSIINAAKIDGAGAGRIYAFIIMPMLKPVFFTAVIVLLHMAIKSFDLVIALTRGGPGFASDLPATFMYAHAFTRGKVALGAASAMMMLFMVSAVLVPYLYSELRRK